VFEDIVSNKQLGNSGRLRVNIGNILFAQKNYLQVRNILFAQKNYLQVPMAVCLVARVNLVSPHQLARSRACACACARTHTTTTTTTHRRRRTHLTLVLSACDPPPPQAIKMYRRGLDQIPVSTHQRLRSKVMRNIGHAFCELRQYEEAAKACVFPLFAVVVVNLDVNVNIKFFAMPFTVFIISFGANVYSLPVMHCVPPPPPPPPPPQSIHTHTHTHTHTHIHTHTHTHIHTPGTNSC
jgi:ABC-type nickel/cobalt efflux system permease component RcnA